MSRWPRIRRALPGLGAVTVVIALLLAGGALVYASGGTKTVYPHLLYVPVVVGALIFGAPGGLLAGLAAGLVMGPLMPLDVAAGVPQETLGWVIRTGFFTLIGGLTGAGQGLLEERRRRLRATRSELRQTEDRFRALVEAVSDYAIIILDPAGQVLSWNEGAERIFGYQAEEAVGGHFSRFYPTGDELPAQELQVAGREGRCEREGWRVRGDGSKFWANTVITALTDPAGRLEGFAKITRDMTERKEARERLEALLRSKDEFIAAVAHELRTPLTAVLGFAELLATEGFRADEPQELAAEIHRQATDLSAIVDDLLVAARIEVGHLSVEPRPVDLEEEARSVIRSLPGATDRVRILGEGYAFADSARVRQVLRNVISNALRHGREEISVVVSDGGEAARVAVRDDGGGVPEESRERIFHPYVTANARPGQPPTLGLGLSVSRKLARLMGGDLTYRREGDGSVFELALPSAATAASAGEAG